MNTPKEKLDHLFGDNKRNVEDVALAFTKVTSGCLDLGIHIEQILHGVSLYVGNLCVVTANGTQSAQQGKTSVDFLEALFKISNLAMQDADERQNQEAATVE